MKQLWLKLWLVTGLLGCGLCVPALPLQDINDRQFTLTKIQFEGLKAVATDKATAVSGLQIGQTVKLLTLREAGQRMLDSGIFRAVTFRYKYLDDKLEATFVVEEAATSLPCSFDNFPWFSLEQIHAAIRQDVPNFDGKATEGGEMIEAIRKALARLLAENKIAGRIEHEMGGLGSSHIFKVEDVKLPICAVTFDGAAAFEAAFLRGALEEMFAYDFSRSVNYLIARDRLIPLYRQKGYLKVRLKPVQGSFNKDGACKEKVTVQIALEEGLSYKWNDPMWNGNQVVTKEVLQRRLLLKPGDVADGLKIDKGIQQVAIEYTNQGYFGLKLEPQPQFDDTARTVTYNFVISEGPQYNIGTLTVTGPNATRGKGLKEQWASIEGKPYDDALVRKAFEKSGVFGRGVSISTQADHEKRVANLTVEIQ